MNKQDFRVPKFARFLIRRLSDQDMLSSIEEDLNHRFQDTAEVKGESNAGIHCALHLVSVIFSLALESVLWRITMLRSYLKIAIRQLIRQKGYSFINVMGLTIGMACFILIGLWVKDELSFDRFHENKDRIYRILNKMSDGSFSPNPTYALAPALKDQHPDVEEFSRVWFQASSLVKYGEKSFIEDNISMADPGFFRMFSFPFIMGDPETALAERDAIVLTENAAQRYFGNENPIGKVLHLYSQNADLRVTGVIEDIPGNSHFQFDFMIRVEFLGEDRLARWEEWTGPSYILLRPNVSADAFAAKIKDIYKQHLNPLVTYSPVLQPLTRVYLYQLGVAGRVKQVYLFSLIAAFILLMACINFMNLTTARSAKRAKEVGMRKVIGAVRPQIIRQYLGEACVVAFLALVLALALVELVLPQFNLATGKTLVLLSQANFSLILTLIMITVATGILAGSYPALFLSSFQPTHTLKSQAKVGNKGSGIRRILIVFQFAISVALIVCTFVVSQQLHFIQTQDLGLNRENVVITGNNQALGMRFDSFRSELSSKPGIRSVTCAAQGPTWVGESIQMDWEGNPSDVMMPIDYTVVDFDFFETFEMEIIQGRGFSKAFPTDMKEACVISETVAKRMGLENPIGTSVYMDHPAWKESFRNARIIGIVKDFHAHTFHNAIRPFVFRMYRPWHQYIFVKVEEGQIPAALANIESVFKSFAPNYPFRYLFYNEAYNRQYMSERQLGRLFNAFALLSIFISCLGLFGLASYTVEQKTKEIGIRKVLGASVPGILALTAKEFIRWILMANLFAWPVAYFVMSFWLQEFAYKVALGPLIFFIAAGLTIFIAFLTVSYQSLKVALANPVDSLRYE